MTRETIIVKAARHLTDPYRTGDLSKLRALLNVEDGDWHVIVGWLLAALMPDVPRKVCGGLGCNQLHPSQGCNPLHPRRRSA